MKARLLIVLLLVIARSNTLQAQVTTKHPTTYHEHWKPCFVVTKKNDTIHGKMRYLVYGSGYGYDCQYKLSFDDAVGNTTNFTPDSLRSYTVFLEHKRGWDTLTYVPLKTHDDLIRHAFLRLCINGTLRVFGYTTGSSGAAVGTIRTIERKYILTTDHELIPVEPIKFKKDMRQIFASCPAILKDLNDKRYNYENWEQIVIDYNNGICK